MNKKLSALLAAGALTVTAVLTGCSAAKDNTKESSDSSSSSSSSSSSGSSSSSSSSNAAGDVLPTVDLSTKNCQEYVDAVLLVSDVVEAQKPENIDSLALMNQVLVDNNVAGLGDLDSATLAEQGKVTAQALTFCGFDGSAAGNASLTLDQFTYTP